jgi:hypothetical protein
MKELKSLVNFLDKNELEYNQEGKDRFKKTGLATMRKLAKALKLQKFEASFNPGGIAVAGDLHLMGMFNENVGIYFSISSGIMKRGFSCMFRTIKHMKDYSGGSNNWMDGNEFSDLDTVKRLVYRQCGIKESELELVRPENLVKAAVSIHQKVGKYDQKEYDKIFSAYEKHLMYGNYFLNGLDPKRVEDLTLATLAYKKHVTTKEESGQFIFQKFTFNGGKGSIADLLNAYRDQIWEIFNAFSGRCSIEDIW